MRHVNIALLSLSIFSTAFAYGEELTQYLNIKTPRTAHGAPIVFEYDGKTTLIGLFSRDHGRDVSALLLNRNKWEPLGQNGHAITGAKGSFIVGVDFTEDSIWILTQYTHGSNPKRRDRFFVYRLVNGRWMSAGPHDGFHAVSNGYATFHLRDGKTPALSFRVFDASLNSYERRGYLLIGEEWVEWDKVRDIALNSWIVAAKNEAFEVKQENGVVFLYEMTTDAKSDARHPKLSVELPRNHEFAKLYFCDHIPSAMLTCSTGSNARCLVVLRSKDADQYQVDLPDASSVVGIARNNRDELLIGTSDHSRVRVYSLVNGVWKLISNASAESGAVVYDPFFTYLDRHGPIMTWEEFFPR